MGALGSYEHQIDVGGKVLRFEGGKIARQANGAVVASLEDTTILTTTTVSAAPREHLDFFPLTVEVEERMYAAGKIPGGFFKREGRPSEGAILTCRLVDRPLRPTFAEGLRNEVQIINTILQTAQAEPYDVLAINASSISTMLAGVPFDGPVAGVRYALVRDGSWITFPTYEQLDNDVVFAMVVAGRATDDGEIAILMVEAEASENAAALIEEGAPEPTEELIAQALEDVKPVLRSLCEAQTAFVEGLGRNQTLEIPRYVDYREDVLAFVDEIATARVREVYEDHGARKPDKNARIDAIRDEVIARVRAEGPADLDENERVRMARSSFRSIEKKAVRALVTEKGLRVDGRGPSDIRPLSAEVGVLSRTHGSSLFQRGDTQVLNVLALGMLRMAQRLDTLHPDDTKRYMHHYNFPPYSTGETGRVGSPKRREIGHGALAERALLPVVPDEETWPYALRLVSEVVSSNGSTSMASVCASTLSLMDGGVPIHAPVAGIAMGLIYEGGVYTTLTDIQGVEDFFGDMDFKVAGTRRFVTALQLDTKLSGIPTDVLGDALVQARDARFAILDVMVEAIPEPRSEVSLYAPRAITIYIPMDKIGEVIGPKGKIIREITEETGAEIDIDDDGSRGVVRIYSADGAAAQAALDRVNAIANPVVPKEGERYHGTVVKTSDFGAFVNLTPGIDGLLHISKLGQKAGRRLEHADEAVEVGDKLWVEVREVRDGGRYSLDYVREEGDDEAPAPRARDDRPSQDRDRPRRDRPRGDRDRPREDREAGRGDRDRPREDREAGREPSRDRDEGVRTRTRSRTRDA